MFKKTIPSYPEYSITKSGDVFKNNKKLKISRKGCVRVSINRKMKLVSELLAETYLLKPKTAVKVIYRDGNNMNVCVDNLIWVTPNYPEIDVPEIEHNGIRYKHIDCIETSQYYINEIGKVFNFVTKKQINPVKDSMGYLRFSYYYSNNGKLHKKTIASHILVYITFKGEYDQEKYEINHIDGNKINNHIDNLEIVKHGDNVRHSDVLGLRTKKYSEKTITIIIDKLKQNKSWIDIHKEYLNPQLNLSKVQSYGLINAVVNNPTTYQKICNDMNFTKGSTISRKT